MAAPKTPKTAVVTDEFVHTESIHPHRVLIIGISSYVGSALAIGLRDHFDVVGTYFNHPVRIEKVPALKLDCLSATEILNCIQKFKPDIVLYCAGMSRIVECQVNPGMADALNHRALTLFFKVLPKPIPFVYFSSDLLFGNETKATPPFNETDTPEPMNELGRSKRAGELLVYGHNRLTYVFRLACLYGETLGGAEFPKSTWLGWMKAQLEKNEKVELFSDQLRSYIYIGDVVRAIRLFLKKPPLKSQLYHLSGGKAQSRLEVGQKAAAILGWDEKLISGIELQDNSKYGWPRPLNSTLANSVFSKEFEFKFQSIEQGLQEYSERLRTGYTKTWG